MQIQCGNIATTNYGRTSFITWSNTHGNMSAVRGDGVNLWRKNIRNFPQKWTFYRRQFGNVWWPIRRSSLARQNRSGVRIPVVAIFHVTEGGFAICPTDSTRHKSLNIWKAWMRQFLDVYDGKLSPQMAVGSWRNISQLTRGGKKKKNYEVYKGSERLSTALTPYHRACTY